MTAQLSPVPRDIMAQPTESSSSQLSDIELLERFSARQEDEVFVQLVHRYGPLVLSVCRRNTFSVQDAEDAFQATFLILSQSAATIRKRSSLASWLYGVALKVSARVRRSQRSSPLEEAVAEQRNPLDELLARHDGMIADEELSALPEKLRKPLVLRYLAGKSNQETASELGITVAALEGRLKRGKARLRARLLRRGVSLTAMVLAFKTTQASAAELPAELVHQTTLLACSPTGVTPTVTSPFSLQIAIKELASMNAMVLPKMLLPLGTAAAALLAIGAHLAYSQGPASTTSTVPLQSKAAEHASTSSSVVTQTKAVQEQAIETTQNTMKSSTPIQEIPHQQDPFAKTDSSVNQVSGTFDQINHVNVDAMQRSPIEQAIEIALRDPQEAIDFTEETLSEVIAYLISEGGLPIVIDDVSLNELGINSNDLVSIHLPQGLSLDSVLSHLLSDLELEAIIHKEVLWITSHESALSLLEPRLYPAATFGGNSKAMREALLKTVTPSSWSTSGGGEADIAILPSGDLLIRQTYSGHKEVSAVIRQMVMHKQRIQQARSIERPTRGYQPEP